MGLAQKPLSMCPGRQGRAAGKTQRQEVENKQKVRKVQVLTRRSAQPAGYEGSNPGAWDGERGGQGEELTTALIELPSAGP